MTTVELISKRGCHLCEDAFSVVDKICTEMGIAWQEKFIEDDPQLASQYFEAVPVLLINGRSHATYRIDPNRLRQAFASLSKP
jgi:glutaredoxin